MVIRTSLSPKAFLKFLLHVEKIFGRKRSFKNAPRTLDLDIIFFEDIKINDKTLNIPHSSWSKRESVVLPLLNLKRKIQVKFLTFSAETPAAALKQAQMECGEDALVVNTKQVKKKTVNTPAIYEVVVAVEDAKAKASCTS